MGIGISIFVAAVGAVLRYAVTGTATRYGVDVHTSGVILMFVGGLGLVLSLLFWSSFAPLGRGRRSTSRSEEVVTQNGQRSGRVVRETHDHVAN